jgi:hypothetical protein
MITIQLTLTESITIVTWFAIMVVAAAFTNSKRLGEQSRVILLFSSVMSFLVFLVSILMQYKKIW